MSWFETALREEPKPVGTTGQGSWFASAMQTPPAEQTAPGGDRVADVGLTGLITGEKPDNRSMFAKAVDVATTPLTDAPTRAARAVGDTFDQRSLDESWFAATLKGLGAGLLEGAGNVITQMTSPLDLAATVTGAKGAKQGASALWTTGSRVLGGLVGLRGAERIATAEDLGDVGVGLAELAGGAAGVALPGGAGAPDTPTPRPSPSVRSVANASDELPAAFGPHATAGPARPERRQGPRDPSEDAAFREYRERLARGEDVRSPASKKLLEQKTATERFREMAASERGEVPISRGTSDTPPQGGVDVPVQPRAESPAGATNVPPVPRDIHAPASQRSLEQAARAMGKSIPDARPLDAARRAGESKFFERLPEPYRDGVKSVIDDNDGFGTQRRQVQPIERTERLADYIQVESRKNLAPGTALNAEETVAYARATANVQDKINGLVGKVNDGTATDFDLAALLAAREEQAIVSANYLGARAETGRALNIQKQLVQAIESKDLIAIREALKNPKIRQDLEGFSKQWAQLGDDTAKLDFLRASRQNTWGDTIRAMYFSNILSGAKTHLRNIIGNTANAAFSNASQVAAVGYDMARSAMTGAERTIFAGELAPRAVGSALGLKQGLDDALFTLQHGYTPKALQTFDVPRPELAGGGANPFNWTGRALEAEDQLFYGIAYNQELYSRLYAKARGEASKRGLKGDEMGRFIEDRLASWKMQTPPDVAEATRQAALRMVYKEEPGQFVQKVLALKEGGGAIGKTLNFVLPFVKTPANIIRQGVEATPLAPLTSQTRAALAAGGREQAEAVGRMTTGTLGLAVLAYWASQGMISGAGPKDPEERASLMERGWRPNSIKIGDTWVDYANTLQPLSQPLFAVANAWEQYHQTGKAPSVPEIIAATGGAVLDQSFFSGLSDLNSALSDPKRYAKDYFARIGQGFVPFSGMSRNIAQAVDPVVRQPEGVGESMKSIIPGASKSVDPKIDRFGQPVERPGNAFSRGLSPVTMSPESKDPVILELERLGVNTLGMPPTKLQKTARFPERELTVEERAEVGQATRTALERLFAHPKWKELDEDVARHQIGRVVKEARFSATQAIRRRGK